MDNSELLPKDLDVLHIPFTVPTPQGGMERSVYAFVLYGKTVTVIDMGVAGAERRILDAIAARGRDAAEVTLALLTHAHPDHVGGARALHAATGAAVAAHAAERHWIEDVELQVRQRPVPGFDRLVGGSVSVNHVLQDGDRLDLNSRTLTVLHTPGHSPGSVSFLLEPDGLLFSGDAVPLPGEMPIYDDPALSLESLERLRQTDFRVLLSAWDVPRPHAEALERIDDGIKWISSVGAAVEKALRAGHSEPMELCREVVRLLELPPLAVNPLVARSLAAHMKQLRA